MNKNSVLFVLLILLMKGQVFAQNKPAAPDSVQRTGSPVGSDTIAERIVFIGDAGELSSRGVHPVVDAVRERIPLDKNTTVVFLGDNLYRVGLPDQEYTTYGRARAILDSQISVVDGTPSQLYMIPGNHDWENGGRGGYNAIIREQIYVSFFNKNKRVHFLPEDGCPGPHEVQLGNDVTLILFDSQWWLHPNDKPGLESDCNCKTEEELVNQIADIAAKNAKRLVILCCHHPFKSNGVHGGFFTLKQHLFPLTDIFKQAYIPLPLLGSVYPVSRSVFGSPQDLKYPAYTNMVTQISAAVKRVAPNLIFAAGHDHNLQLMRDSSYYYLVSGGGSKQQRTAKSKKSLFNSISQGFAVLEVSKNKNVTLQFYTVTDSVRTYPPFSLMNITEPPKKLDSLPSVPVEDPFLKYKDTTTKPITTEFPDIKGLKKIFMGENYRREWMTPVNMKVFNVNKEKGGFTITGLGGGQQTQTLKLKDKNNKEWVLRTVNKNPGQTIPESFRGNLATDLQKELKSASYPYGALIVPGLTSTLGLAAPSPELFFVPDDPALGFYRSLFANQVCMLEKSDPTFDNTNARSTAKIFNEMLEDNDHRPVERDVLRARLLDMVIADYDRHFDQWKWDTQDTGKGKIYYPIPRDRDQAFFYSHGIILKILSGYSLPFLKGFRPDIPKVNWLNYTARDFDRIYMTNLGVQEWNNEINEVTGRLTDSVINRAVRRLPPEIFRLHGQEIIDKMISRRKRLPAAAMRYYKFLSKRVNIIGSNQKEYFRISSTEGGKLHIRVYARSKADTSFIMYDRTFDPAVTREIRMFGLNDKDVFEIEANTSSPIKLRLIGGQDYDTFRIRGNVEALLYDVKDTGNAVFNEGKGKNRFSMDSPVNERSIVNFNYDYNKFPQLRFEYNTDDRGVAGMGFSRRTFGFRNLPYASDQSLLALYAFDRKAWNFSYRGVFNHVTRNIDLILQGSYNAPVITNFFGIGNHIKIQESSRYYQVRYNRVEFQALVRRRYFEKFHGLFGPYYYSYSATYNDNKNTVLGKPGQVGLDSAHIFSKKSYLGGKILFVADNRNSELFPTRGVLWINDITAMAGMNKNSNNIISYRSDMTVHASFSDPAKLVAVLKIGGGRIFTKNYEYFQAMSLGFNDGLNGFHKNRYLGKSSFYTGLEFRIKIMEVNSYIMPGQLGLTVFGNAGKVHSRQDQSRAWHTAYGFGFYYLPFNLFTITGSVGFHRGEKMTSFSIGTRFNLGY